MEAPVVDAELVEELKVGVHRAERALQRRQRGVVPRPLLGRRAKGVAAVAAEGVPVRDAEAQPFFCLWFASLFVCVRLFRLSVYRLIIIIDHQQQRHAAALPQKNKKQNKNAPLLHRLAHDDLLRVVVAEGERVGAARALIPVFGFFVLLFFECQSKVARAREESSKLELLLQRRRPIENARRCSTDTTRAAAISGGESGRGRARWRRRRPLNASTSRRPLASSSFAVTHSAHGSRKGNSQRGASKRSHIQHPRQPAGLGRGALCSRCALRSPRWIDHAFTARFSTSRCVRLKQRCQPRKTKTRT